MRQFLAAAIGMALGADKDAAQFEHRHANRSRRGFGGTKRQRPARKAMKAKRRMVRASRRRNRSK